MSNTIFTSEKVLEKLIQDAVRKVFEEIQNSQTQNQQKNLLTVQEASNYLQISVSTLYHYTSDEYIPFIKKGKRIYFSKEDLDVWVLERKHKSLEQINWEILEKQRR